MSTPIHNAPIPKICSELSLKTHRFDYQLVVDRFKSQRVQEGFRSDHFSIPGLAEPKFYIKCSQKRRQYVSSKFHDFKIFLLVCEKSDLFSNLTVSFDIKGFDESGKQHFGSNSSGNFIPLSEPILLCRFKYPRNFSGDKLMILCEFTFEIDTYSTKIVSPIHSEEENFLATPDKPQLNQPIEILSKSLESKLTEKSMSPSVSKTDKADKLKIKTEINSKVSSDSDSSQDSLGDIHPLTKMFLDDLPSKLIEAMKYHDEQKAKAQGLKRKQI